MTAVGPSSLSGLLAEHAERRSSAVALRYKHHGIWHVRTWSELLGDVTQLAWSLSTQGFASGGQLAVASEGSRQALMLSLAAQWLGGTVVLLDPNGPNWAAHAREVPWLYVDSSAWPAVAALRPRLLIYGAGQVPVTTPGAIALRYDQLVQAGTEKLSAPSPQGAPQAFLTPQEPERPGDLVKQVQQARQWVSHTGLDGDDEVLMGSSFATRAHVRLVLLPWVVAGLRLNICETPATRVRDRREVAPTLVAGNAEHYVRLHSLVTMRKPLSGSFSGWLYDRAMATDAGPWSGPLGYWLVRRPLLDVLGLGRVKVALLDGPELPSSTRTFFSRLGLAPRPPLARLSTHASASTVPHALTSPPA